MTFDTYLKIKFIRLGGGLQDSIRASVRTGVPAQTRAGSAAAQSVARDEECRVWTIASAEPRLTQA
jgi:hypothetical protein